MFNVFMEIFTKYFNKSTHDFYARMNPDIPRPIPVALRKSYENYMKEHEGDWYRSQEFLNMFLYCPAEMLGFMTKMYYGNGKSIKGGVNLSERVIECLKIAFNRFKLEQHTMQKAFAVETILEHLGHEVDPGEGP